MHRGDKLYKVAITNLKKLLSTSGISPFEKLQMQF